VVVSDVNKEWIHMDRDKSRTTSKRTTVDVTGAQDRVVGLDNNDNDNDKRLGLTAKADHPDHKKYNTPKIKMENEAVQKLQTS